VFSIEGGLASPAPKRKRTTSTTNRPQKCKHSFRLRIGRGMFENLQGSSSQPLELHNPESEQPEGKR